MNAIDFPTYEDRPSAAGRFAARAALYVLLVLGGITMILPFFWMVSSSLKSPAQLFQVPPTWIPSPPRWSNYEEMWVSINFARYFLNSCFISITVTVVTVILSAMTGFAFAKYKFPAKRFLFFFFISTLMIPGQVTLIPLFLIFRQMGLLNTYLALILPGLTSAFGIFLMHQFILGIPDDLLESARIDGCSEAGVFWRMVLPNVKPAASTLAIFIFIQAWNDFLWPLIAINSDKLKPIQVGLASFVGQHSSDWHLIMAGATCALVPVLVIFLFFQRQFVAGIVMSGLKE